MTVSYFGILQNLNAISFVFTCSNAFLHWDNKWTFSFSFQTCRNSQLRRATQKFRFQISACKSVLEYTFICCVFSIKINFVAFYQKDIKTVCPKLLSNSTWFDEQKSYRENIYVPRFLPPVYSITSQTGYFTNHGTKACVENEAI